MEAVATADRVQRRLDEIGCAAQDGGQFGPAAAPMSYSANRSAWSSIEAGHSAAS
jgi:hypothetical protein